MDELNKTLISTQYSRLLVESECCRSMTSSSHVIENLSIVMLSPRLLDTTLHRGFPFCVLLESHIVLYILLSLLGSAMAILHLYLNLSKYQSTGRSRPATNEILETRE